MKKLAFPVAGGVLCAHFGHCESFVLIDIDEDSRTVKATSTVAAPPHEPGLLPAWLAGMGVEVVIAGGMGSRARDLFTGKGISVVTGAECLAPDALAKAYMEGELRLGENACDH